MSELSCPLGLNCQELPCPNQESCQFWTLPLPIPWLRNSECWVVEPVSLLLAEYAQEHQIDKESYSWYFFREAIKGSYREGGWQAAEPLPYEKREKALVVRLNQSSFAPAVELEAMKGRKRERENFYLWIGFIGAPLYKYGYFWLSSESTWNELWGNKEYFP
ncbi:MAG: hypothetical protein AB4206_03050 [Xenococcaceae cyanobacterium]